MSDFDHDLYGDLDLEDLDATALEEELVDPDADAPADLKPFPASPPPQASSHAAPPPVALPSHVSPSSGLPHHGGGGGSGGGSSGVGGSGGGGMGGMGGGGLPMRAHDPHGDDAHSMSGAPGDRSSDRIKPSDMPDEGKMFIGGLNWETTDDGLRAYFTAYGDIDQCTIMRDPTGRSRGFAFLTFKDPASVYKVLERDHQLDGKMIDPKRAIPRAEHERTAKVFVGGLAPTVTSDVLKRFLAQFGKVMDATVMFDRLNGRSKGFAFATFADEDGVDKAMAHSGIELEGRQIEIKKAQPRGAGTQVKSFNAPGGARTSNFNATAGAMNMPGFDPSAMAMMYQNMLKAAGAGAGGGMGMGAGMAAGAGAGAGAAGGFDPNAMAVMYQNMMKNMGMNQAPAINPNVARGGMANGMSGMGMGGLGMGSMGMGGMGMNMMGMGMGMGGGMGGMGAGMGGMGGMGGAMSGGMGGGMAGGGMGGRGRNVPNAPRGPAAMRNTGGPSGMAQPMASGPGAGSGPQRYSTQGSQRSRPY